MEKKERMVAFIKNKKTGEYYGNQSRWVRSFQQAKIYSMPKYAQAVITRGLGYNCWVKDAEINVRYIYD